VKLLNPNFNFSENTKNRVNAEIGNTARKSPKTAETSNIDKSTQI